MYIKIVEHEKCLCKQAHNSTVGYNATINTSVHIFMIHGISTITVNFNIYIYKKINTKTCISVVSYLKNSSAKRTCGYRIMPLLTSRTRARVPFGTSFASHAHVHASMSTRVHTHLCLLPRGFVFLFSLTAVSVILLLSTIDCFVNVRKRLFTLKINHRNLIER